MSRKLIVMCLAGLICLLLVNSTLAMTYDEAPMLRTKVAAGELPSLEQRLPEEPMIVETIEEIGEYGGTLRLASTWPGDLGDGDTINLAVTLLGMTSDLKTITPNILRSWEFSEEGKTLRLFLRKGMKWSDGDPVTADDILFWYEDVFMNDELTPSKWAIWQVGGEVMKMVRIDDYTVEMHFALPYPFAITLLAHWPGLSLTSIFPKHYMKQFHPNYVSAEKLENMVKEGGFEHWYQLFQERAKNDAGAALSNTELPVLTPYVLAEENPGYWLYERNPYYWKVDTKGNQLPYIDKLLITIVENVEMASSKAAIGEFDFVVRHLSLDNYPLYTANAEKGNFQVLLWKGTYGASFFLQFNQTYEKDLVLRDIFRDVRFRQALSLAIDREEINEALYFGEAVPRQYTALPECDYYEEEFARAYAEYNPEEAKRLLDEMGLDKKDNQGFRLRSDGERLSWTIEYTSVEAPQTPTLEIVKEFWRDVGIQLFLKEISGELKSERYVGNEVAMGTHEGCGSTNSQFLLWPIGWFPVHRGWEATWCPLWAQWYVTDGELGEEPPEGIKRLQYLYDTMKTTFDDQERIEMGKEVLRIHAENVYSIGMVGAIPIPVIVNSALRNVPEKLYYGWDSFFGAYLHPEQLFFKQN